MDDHMETIVEAAKPLALIMIDPDTPESVKHHLHEAMHHMTVAVLKLAAYQSLKEKTA